MIYASSTIWERRRKMAKSKCNPICAGCARAQNGINGRYCFELGVYVEHHAEPRCGRERKNVEQFKTEMAL